VPIAKRRAEHRDDILDADPAEIVALLLDAGGPPAAELNDRRQRRLAAAAYDPPIQLGERPAPDPTPMPEHVAMLVGLAARSGAVGSGRAGSGMLHGSGVGTGTARGRACVIDTDEGIADLRPGDILVATTTLSAHNPLFPIVTGLATAEGGLFSHPALLAREFAIPAVVGVPDLLDHVHHGDTIEVDAPAGQVRVIK